MEWEKPSQDHRRPAYTFPEQEFKAVVLRRNLVQRNWECARGGGSNGGKGDAQIRGTEV